MKKNTIGKIDTTTMLLIGAAAVGIYFFTRPPAAAPLNYGLSPGYPYGGTALNYLNPAGGSNLAQDISAGGTAAGGLATLVTAFGHLF